MNGLKDLIAKSVVDNLDSNSSTSPLSARCGKSLQKEILFIERKNKRTRKESRRLVWELE